MAHFLIQSDDVLDIELTIVKNLLSHTKYIHTFETISLKDIKNYTKENAIPIGTIDFVSTYINNVYGIDREIPIEIPIYLQTTEFLKRTYSICDWKQIPRTGKYFLKDISILKEFSSIIDTRFYDIDELFNYKKKSDFDATLVLNKDHLFQISSILPIKSEYRVYVINHKIEAIANYDGDPLLYPDMQLLQKANNLINLHEKHLKSYTIDLAVGDFGTAILEIHNFTSVGLYHSLWGDDLLYAYIDGINYLKDDNSIKYK